MQVVSLSVFRFSGARHRIWAFSQMGLARRALRAIPDIGFAKQFGSGGKESFHPYPNLGVYGILAVWPGLEIARQRIEQAAVLRAYRAHASETFSVFLAGVSVRGQWDGQSPFEAAAPPDTPSPLAVLTRATIKPRHLWRFWRAAPNISAMTTKEPAMLFKIGLGEVPWLHQVTFSIWTDSQAMTDFAYKSGYHREAVRLKRQEGWFSEELFARFRVLAAEGRWQGREPLAAISRLAA